MNADTYGLAVPLLQLPVERLDYLIQCSLRGTIRVPSPAFVICDRAQPRGDVHPLCESALVSCYRACLWEKASEVFDKEQVRNDIDLERLLYDVHIKIGGLLLRMQYSSCHERCVKI